MEIWICRHGESIAEVNKIIQGHIDGELSELGLVQSKLLANRLQFAKFCEIISSDLNRAKFTTSEILEYKKDTPIQYDGRLREKASGVFENKTMIQYKTEAIKKGGSLREFRPNGGESWLDVLERSTDVINDLIIKYVKKDYLDSLNLKDNSSSNVNNIDDKSFKHSNTTTFKKNTEKGNDKMNQMMIQKKLMRLNTMTQMKNSLNEMNSNVKTFYPGEIIKRNDTLKIDNTLNVGRDKEMEMIVSNNNKNSSSKEDFLTLDLEKLFLDEEYQRKTSKIYRGFNPDLNFPRVLLVTHGGFIMEFFNSIRIKKNIRIKFVNDSKPASLYIIRVYCINCGALCYSKDKTCKIEFDVILYNNRDHLLN